MSLKGSLPWRVTTCIISSGVTPLAQRAAMNEPGRGPDVDVEVVDRAVYGQQIQGSEGPDLVHAPGEAAPAEDQGGLVAAPAAAALDRRGATNPTCCQRLPCP